jgi:dihydrofolate synthase / folylpolyglutamate synthase
MGYRVGRYSSPHLIDFSERILVDGRPVPHERILRWLEEYTPVIDALGATFFEATTVMAFDLFVEAAVDVAVIEVGLGGRLDSTNILTPLVATVTAIGLDHREYLGDTLELIALEKAGIFKPGVPAVIGERDPAIIACLTGAAERAGASRIVCAPDQYAVTVAALTAGGTAMTIDVNGSAETLTSSLVGAHQAQNVVTALAALNAAGGEWKPSVAAFRAGAAATVLAGRFQRLGPWIFDVAHNPDGIATVVDSLLAIAPAGPLGAVVCVLADKDWHGMLQALMPHLDAIWLTEAPTAPAGRRWPLHDVAAFARSVRAERAPQIAIEPQLAAALRSAQQTMETVVVTGSFHTVGDAMELLQIDPLAG